MKVIVSGAGIAGLALAQRLAAQGAEVVVLEKARTPREGGYMIDFFGPGYDAAEAMGVLPRIIELSYHVRELVYCDDFGRRRAGLQYTHFANAAGGRVLNVLRGDLERALREHMPAHVEIRYGRTITAVDNRSDGVGITLDDGVALAADLLVGCDGIHSTVRSLIFGPEDRYLRYLGFHTAAFSFIDPAAQAEIADRFCMTDTLHCAMGFYRVRDGRVAVFTVHPAPDPTLPTDARAALRHHYAGLGWIAPRALAACPPTEQVYYDQVAQIVMASWTRGRVALLGDAAYAVSLLAGQGAALAIAGAHLLAEHLAGSASIDNALATYESAFRPVVLDRQKAARKGARWLVPSTRCRLRLRHLALATAGLPFTGRFLTGALVGKSAALTGTQPALTTPSTPRQHR